MPSEKGSRESTSSSSASPPSVIIWYISLSRVVMTLKPAMNSSSRRRRRSSCCRRWLLRTSVMWSSSATRLKYTSSCNQQSTIRFSNCKAELAGILMMCKQLIMLPAQAIMHAHDTFIRPHDAPRWSSSLPVTAAWAWNALPSSVRSAPRCSSSAATWRRHCFSHRTLLYSVQLCDRL